MDKMTLYRFTFFHTNINFRILINALKYYVKICQSYNIQAIYIDIIFGFLLLYFSGFRYFINVIVIFVTSRSFIKII
jgi:uncharacterized membrane protein